MNLARVLRGRLLCPRPEVARVDEVADGLVRIAAGEAVQGACEVAETYPGAVLLPGFVDAHVHFPQTRVLGSASGPLLPWLERSVFPEEARFAAPTSMRDVEPSVHVWLRFKQLDERG